MSKRTIDLSQFDDEFRARAARGARRFRKRARRQVPGDRGEGGVDGGAEQRQSDAEVDAPRHRAQVHQPR